MQTTLILSNWDKIKRPSLEHKSLATIEDLISQNRSIEKEALIYSGVSGHRLLLC